MLCTALMALFTIPLYGQAVRDTTAKKEMERIDISVLIGKTAVDTTVEGLHMRFWLITQQRRKTAITGKMEQKLMGMEVYEPEKETDPTKVNMAMDRETTRLMMAGTHFIIADVTDSTSGSEIVDPSVSLEIISPSKKKQSVDLIRTMNHFGLGITLKEKGKYHLTMNVNANGFSRIVHFTYRVR
jgi:hypothetical protein